MYELYGGCRSLLEKESPKVYRQDNARTSACLFTIGAIVAFQITYLQGKVYVKPSPSFVASFVDTTVLTGHPTIIWSHNIGGRGKGRKKLGRFVDGCMSAILSLIARTSAA